mmetsp:Transcript_104634/g.207803  ORF Transcript_104634/g.207803 Transcript_104634/m.207803 type:complete len:206 (+) Transcript_104634:19-636(+)
MRSPAALHPATAATATGSTATSAGTSPSPERRIDPQDDRARTLRELRELCANSYSEEEITDYWRRRCRPLDVGMGPGTLCIARVSTTIFASPSSWERMGLLGEGQPVVVAGPSQVVDGYVMVPIEPSGAVDAAALAPSYTGAALCAAAKELLPAAASPTLHAVVQRLASLEAAVVGVPGYGGLLGRIVALEAAVFGTDCQGCQAS